MGKMIQKAKKGFVTVIAGIMVSTVMVPGSVSAAAGASSPDVTIKNATIANKKACVEPKKKYQMTVKAAGKNVTKKATYKTSNKKVASVSKAGKITTKKTGNVTITVKYQKKITKIKLKVHNHKWAEHTATRQERELVLECRLCGEINPDREHVLNHLLNDGYSGQTSAYITKTVTYTDYYYCTICGAQKKASKKAS